jgi:hypothetical protein
MVFGLGSLEQMELDEARHTLQIRVTLRARRSLGISAVDHLQRLRRRGRYRERSGRATVVGRRGHDHGSARLNRVYGGGRTPRVHDRFDARRSGAWRGAAARYGRRFGAPPERRSARPIVLAFSLQQQCEVEHCICVFRDPCACRNAFDGRFGASARPAGRRDYTKLPRMSDQRTSRFAMQLRLRHCGQRAGACFRD